MSDNNFPIFTINDVVRKSTVKSIVQEIAKQTIPTMEILPPSHGTKGKESFMLQFNNSAIELMGACAETVIGETTKITNNQIVLRAVTRDGKPYLLAFLSSATSISGEKTATINKNGSLKSKDFYMTACGFVGLVSSTPTEAQTLIVEKTGQLVEDSNGNTAEVFSIKIDDQKLVNTPATPSEPIDANQLTIDSEIRREVQELKKERAQWDEESKDLNVEIVSTNTVDEVIVSEEV